MATHFNTARLSKRAVDALAPRNKAFVAFDDDVKGFGVRVMPSGCKTFVLEYRPGAGGRGVVKRRLTLGRYGSMTVEQARKAALDALAQIRLGTDPQAMKMGQRAALSVSDLIDAFLRGHVGTKLKPGTAAGYKIALATLREAYGSTKAEIAKARRCSCFASILGGDTLSSKSDSGRYFLPLLMVRTTWVFARRARQSGTEDRLLPRAEPRAIFDQRRTHSPWRRAGASRDRGPPLHR